MSDRMSYVLAVLLLIVAAVFRIHDLATLPPGLSNDEIDNVRIVETVRDGTIETYYNLRGEGRESLYQIFVVAMTTFTGNGLIGYRLTSVFVGLLTLAVVYVLGKRLFGALAGLAGMALLTFGLFPTLLARATLPEALLPLLTAATLLALAQSLSVNRVHHTRSTNSISFAALGVILGIGFYIHPLHYGIVLVAMVFIGYMVLSRQPISRFTLGFTSFAILVMIIIVMPYLIASIRQPELSGAARVLIGYNQGLIATLLDGLSGLIFRGDVNPIYNLPQRPLIDLISGIIAALGLVAALRYWRQPRFALLLIAVIILLPLALIAPDSPDFKRFALILPLVALLFGAGIEALTATISQSGRLAFGVILILLLGFNLQWTWRDLFGEWRALPTVQTAYHERLGALARYLDGTSLTTPSLICTPELYPPDDAMHLVDAQIMVLMMHQVDAPLRYADCGSALVLADGGNQQQIVFLEPDGLERVNPYLAQWIDQGAILTEDAPPNAVIKLDVSQSLADTIGRFTTTATASFAPETGNADTIAETPIRLGGNITFLGYDRVTTDAYAPGAVIPVYTYWRVDGQVPMDLRFFTHLLSDPAVIAVQADTIGVRADLLELRDVIIQATFLQLPFTIPEGDYLLSTGAYERNRGTRLGVFDGDQLRGDRLFIGTITVAR
ncbi:MAG: glycosyltransferase family 39 protein [Anaerolineae bacterium]|nr:glycosyltransferase family 39 protein [Anaerolineae bacterium]